MHKLIPITGTMCEYKSSQTHSIFSKNIQILRFAQKRARKFFSGAAKISPSKNKKDSGKIMDGIFKALRNLARDCFIAIGVSHV